MAVNDQDVHQFLEAVDNEERQADSLAVRKLMEEITGQEAKMWGSRIVGFDQYSG